MQEIEFRGQRADTKEWVYGDITFTNYFKKEEVKPFILNPIDVRECGYNAICHEVIPETVGQYIGIKDIYGKKVFRGDIVKVKEIVYTNCYREEIEEIREYTGEVVWHLNGWFIAIKKEKGILYNSLWLWNVEDNNDDTMEIIGNHWDNPEMRVIA